MRIALIADAGSPHTRTWANGLAERGAEVLLFSPHRVVPLPGLKVTVHAPLPAREPIPPRAPDGTRTRDGRRAPAAPRSTNWELRSITRALRLAPVLRRWLRTVRPDRVVALRFQPEGYLAGLSGAHPLILVSWGQDVLWFAQRHPLHRYFTRRSIAAADRVIGETRAVVEAMISLGARPRRAAQGFTGIDTDFWSQAAIPDDPASPDGHAPARRKAEACRLLRERHPEWGGWLDRVEQGTPAVLSPRAIGPHGHQRELIRAWAGMARTGGGSAPLLLQAGASPPDENAACLHLAGTMGDATLYQELGAVPREDLRALYWLSDVAASLWSPDGLSQCLLEMMAAGAWPVAADLPGNREWITPGVNGSLVDPTDGPALAQALEAGLRDQSLRLSGARRNRVLIRERADRAGNMDRLLELILRTEMGEE